MTKIEINLYSQKEPRPNRTFDLMKKYFPYAVLGFCALLLINLILCVAGGVSVFSLKKTKKQWSLISDQAEAMGKIKNEINILRTEKKQYSDLFNSGTDLSRLLAELYRSLPENIWLEEVRFRNSSLVLKGYALRWKEDPLTSVALFIDKFKKQEYFFSRFTQVSSRKSRRTEYKGQAVTEFEIECRN